MTIARDSRTRTVNVSAIVDEQIYNLYTCPANCKSHMSLLFLSNTGGNVSVDVEWDRADSTHAHILGGKNLTTGEFIQFSDGFIVLEAGDEINVVADGSDPHVDFFCTVEEFFLPQQSGVR